MFTSTDVYYITFMLSTTTSLQDVTAEGYYIQDGDIVMVYTVKHGGALLAKDKVNFPKKRRLSRKTCKRYLDIKRRETPLNKNLKLTEKALIDAGVKEENHYFAKELTEMLTGGGAVNLLLAKLPKEFVVIPYVTGNITVKRKVARYSGADIYKLVKLREARLLPKRKYTNFNDNTGKLPSTLHMNKKKRNRKALKVRCEHCGCEIPKGMRKPRKLSYTEMLRDGGKFKGILVMRKLRSEILKGRRSYVRDREG